MNDVDVGDIVDNIIWYLINCGVVYKYKLQLDILSLLVWVIRGLMMFFMRSDEGLGMEVDREGLGLDEGQREVDGICCR